jgi:hypothetical protein
VTDREAPPNWDFDYRPDDPYEDDGWFGGEPVADPAPVNESPDPVHAPSANTVREEPDDPATVVYRAPSPPPRPVASPTVSTWTVNGQLRASNTSTLTFRSPPAPWYRTKQATIAMIAAVAVPVVVLLWPSSTATGPSEPTSVAPQASMSVQPPPSSAHPTPINAPPPLPPPPPPLPLPPPAEDTGSAPAVSQPEWTRSAPEPTRKPEIGVTRAPISVAPVPRQPQDSATPGDGSPGGRRGWRCGGFC